MEALHIIARFFARRAHRSKTPTGLLPLSQIHSATVFRDPEEPEPNIALHRFFDPLGIEVTTISQHDRNVRSGGDLFIALSSQKSISEEYAALSSTARFKVGRRQLPGNVYDLVYTDPEGEVQRQEDAFKAISALLEKIR